jgi:hypothetical protein
MFDDFLVPRFQALVNKSRFCCKIKLEAVFNSLQLNLQSKIQTQIKKKIDHIDSVILKQPDKRRIVFFRAQLFTSVSIEISCPVWRITKNELDEKARKFDLWIQDVNSLRSRLRYGLESLRIKIQSRKYVG